MSALLGILALLIGFPLVCFGIWGMVLGFVYADPATESGKGIAGYGMLATLFGSLLCYVAWRQAMHDDGE
jgi:hypothetical protein